MIILAFMRDFLQRMGKSLGLLSILLLMGVILSVPAQAQCLTGLTVESVQVEPESCQGANDGEAIIRISQLDDSHTYALLNKLNEHLIFNSLYPKGIKIEVEKANAQIKVGSLPPGNYALVVFNKGDMSCSKTFDAGSELLKVTSTGTICNE